MQDRSSKRPEDPNQLAKLMVEIEPGKTIDEAIREKNPAAVALGRLGGEKGGRARALKLSASERSEIARKAAKSRWMK